LGAALTVYPAFNQISPLFVCPYLVVFSFEGWPF
jgi:hypothetical protein